MKFAHMADLHLGAVSDPKMKGLESSTLEKAFRICEEKGVDFVIIAGDIFHINIPDLSVVKEAVEVFKRFTDTGRKIYVVYGSHDFSPNSTSIIDVLEAAGVVVRVGKPSASEGKLRPEVVTDEMTGAKITGISGRRTSLEKEAFTDLDRDYLKAVDGFKIFVFHTGLLEMRREGEKFDGISQSMLPDGFDYYAGGHIHRVFVDKSGRVVFPGPLFTGWGADLEATVLGERRGFYMVEADQKGKPRLEFVELKPFEGIHKVVDATGKTAEEINEELRLWATEVDATGKVVLLKVQGELSSGRTSDIEFGLIREILAESGAIYLHLNRNALRTKEMGMVTAMGESAEEIEGKIFKEMAGAVKGRDGNPVVKDEPAAAARLLSVLRNPKQEGESLEDYFARMSREARSVLGILSEDGSPAKGGSEGGAKASDERGGVKARTAGRRGQS
ncbi:MAG: metallophosphoesterase family protein [Candidatus Methanosuratincola sp.]|jgi:DNA repair exonuclease SbcCD nuclease subunit|nr:exonuclease SbcCD subunit D [Candidatus Methanosuratincola sp.]